MALPSRAVRFRLSPPNTTHAHARTQPLYTTHVMYARDERAYCQAWSTRTRLHSQLVTGVCVSHNQLSSVGTVLYSGFGTAVPATTHLFCSKEEGIHTYFNAGVNILNHIAFFHPQTNGRRESGVCHVTARQVNSVHRYMKKVLMAAFTNAGYGIKPAIIDM